MHVFETDQYRVSSALGILRFWHLALLAYLYLAEQRAPPLAAGADRSLTIG